MKEIPMILRILAEYIETLEERLEHANQLAGEFMEDHQLLSDPACKRLLEILTGES